MLAERDLQRIEESVRRALAPPGEVSTGPEPRVLGYGEISSVIGWPRDDPTVACKRLPVFASTGAASRYQDLFERYLWVLSERGVEPLRSEFHTLPAGGGRVVGYVLQPVLPSASLGPEVLRVAEADPEHPLLSAVVEAVAAVLDDRTGFDAQISNWALHDGVARYLDVTTPMIFDAAGRLELDTGVFLAAYPWALRYPIGRFVAPGVVAAYRDRRHVLVDMAANLIKERLEHWVPAVLEAIGRILTPVPTREEVERYYRSDARLWEVMLRLRRADRWWQHHVRRREYAFLLPGRIDR